jgi:hypothetical protein
MTRHRKDIYVLADSVRVTHDTQMPFRSCHGDIEPSLFAEESYFVLRVTTHCADNHRFFLATLEAIDRPELEVGILFLEHS